MTPCRGVCKRVAPHVQPCAVQSKPAEVVPRPGRRPRTARVLIPVRSSIKGSVWRGRLCYEHTQRLCQAILRGFHRVEDQGMGHAAGRIGDVNPVPRPRCGRSSRRWEPATGRGRPCRGLAGRSAVPGFPACPNVDTLPALGLDNFLRSSTNLGTGTRWCGLPAPGMDFVCCAGRLLAPGPLTPPSRTLATFLQGATIGHAGRHAVPVLPDGRPQDTTPCRDTLRSVTRPSRRCPPEWS